MSRTAPPQARPRRRPSHLAAHVTLLAVVLAVVSGTTIDRVLASLPAAASYSDQPAAQWAPTEPPPDRSAPAEPPLVQSAPTEPQLVQSAPAEPLPARLAPAEPARVQSVPAEPPLVLSPSIQAVAAPLVLPPALNRRVLSYFYYWYGPVEDRLVRGRDGWPWPEPDKPRERDEQDLTLHFPPARPANWRSTEWFRNQFSDMQTAGVDVALAVYWGDSLYPNSVWSTEGLERLTSALDELEMMGQAHPRVGLFFDTYVLQGAALTEPEQRAWLADQIRAYFRRVPDRYRATEQGRPIIWLYLSNFANSFDQTTFDLLGDELEGDLGARPFWVADLSWSHATSTDDYGERFANPGAPVSLDALYRWGAAMGGTRQLRRPLPVASVGPGYDDSAIEERGDERSVRSREGGCFYARSWQKAREMGAQWVVVETWNELYEGSAIAETMEYGREYIEATARYTTAFKHDDEMAVSRECGDYPLEDDAAPDEAAPVGAEAPE